MFNIMNTIERTGTQSFIEEWGNVLIFFCKHNIDVFALEKYYDEEKRLWGIRAGLRFKDGVMLDSNPRTFEERLDPRGVDAFTKRDLNSIIVQMYEKRDLININLNSLMEDVYYTAISNVELGAEDEIRIMYNNAIQSSADGYFKQGLLVFFNITEKDKQELNNDGIADEFIYAFIKIYMIAWFQSQPSLN